MRDAAEITDQLRVVDDDIVKMGLSLAEENPPSDDPRWRDMCKLMGAHDALRFALGEGPAPDRMPPLDDKRAILQAGLDRARP